MGTVLAPYPSYMDAIDDKSVTTIERDATDVTFRNRAGVILGTFTIRNSQPLTYVECLRRIGAFDSDNYDVLIKDWHKPFSPNARWTPLGVQRTNLAPNPSFENNTTGWAASSGTIARIVATAQAGTAVLRSTASAGGAFNAYMVADLPMVPGEKVAFSYYVKSLVTARAFVATIEWKDSFGNTVGITTSPTVTDNTSTFTRVSVAGYHPTAVWFNVSITQATGAASEQHYIDAVLIEKSDTVGTYFDGSTTDTVAMDYGWTGAAGNSSSTETPTALPPLGGHALNWSPDGKYLAIVLPSAPYLTIYKYVDGVFTKLGNPATLPTGTAKDVEFSPNGQYLSVTHSVSPFVTIYKRAGDVFTKLANPGTLPTGNGFENSWSSDGQYLAVGHQIAPFITVYKRTGDAFAKIADPSVIPSSTGLDVAFSPGTRYLAVSQSSTPFLALYKRTGDTLEKLGTPTGGYPTVSSSCVAWSPNGRYLAVGQDSNSLVVYKRDGDVFTKLSVPEGALTAPCEHIAWSPDSNYLVGTIGDTSPYISVYKRTGDVFSLVTPSVDVAPPAYAYGAEWSPDGKLLAVSHAGSPYFSLYKSQQGPVSGIAIRLTQDAET